MRTLIFIGLCLSFCGFCVAETTTIAVASNFKTTLQILADQFQTQHPQHTVRISSASTGILYNQIKHGARFDILLAADEKHPRLLAQKHLGLAQSRFTYAQGQLALGSSSLKLATFNEASIKELLQNTKGKLAIANPTLAPYGAASQQTLEYLQLWQALKKQLVTGSNINQSYQFISTGNAIAGFINLAAVKQTNPNQPPLHYWIIPSHWYQPIRQQAILLQSGINNRAARSFYDYLQSPVAAKLIQQHGYLVTANSSKKRK